ncbi:MAG: glycosyltransferase family 39 protein, partial [Pyrinomonadaceae bacterium]|nr:glycosyltransferase family 39 protein [Phycisphaerales bacterium]
MRIVDLSIGKIRRGNDAAGLEPRQVRTLARSWRAGGIGLVLLCLLVYVPGLWTIPPIDRDESRFAQASRQMLESGTLSGWIVPMVQDKPRLNKPPLIYWLQAGSAALLGDAPDQWAWLDGESQNVWVYRVPSVLAAMMTVLLTWRLGVRMFDPRAAWLAAALLAVCPMVVWDAHQARADQVLLAMTTATMLCLWVVWKQGIDGSGHPGIKWRASDPSGANRREVEAAQPGVRQDAFSPADSFRPSAHAAQTPVPRSGWKWPVLFWLFLTLGVMTKGPITPMVAGLTALSLSLLTRRWRWLLDLRPLVGIVILVAIVAPWVYGVTRVLEDPALQLRMGMPLPSPGEPARSGFAAYWSIVYAETIGRSAGAKEGHWGPPGYHIVLLGALFWPGSLLTAAAIGRAWKRGLVARMKLNEEVAETAEGRKSGRFASLRGSVASWLRRLYHSRAGRPAELFCLAWMLPSWIVFELISTKLPHYTMPLYPAVAMLSARMLFAARTSFFPYVSKQRAQRLSLLLQKPHKCPGCTYQLTGLRSSHCPECGLPLSVTDQGRLAAGYQHDPGQRAGRFIWVVLGVAIGVVGPLALLVWSISSKDEAIPLSWRPIVIIPAAMVLIVNGMMIHFAVKWQRQGGLIRSMLVSIMVSITFSVGVLGHLLPRAPELWLSVGIKKGLRDMGWTPDTPLATLGYYEDSLIFLTRGRAVRLPLDGRASFWIAE